MHDSGAPASLSGGWDGHQDTIRPTASAPGKAGTLGVDHMVAFTGHRPNHRPLAKARQEMKDPPTAKRQDQEDQEPGALISPTEQITVPRQPRTIYPLRISPLEPTRRLTEAMARSVKSPLPTSTRQYQIKRLYEKHLYDVCEEA